MRKVWAILMEDHPSELPASEVVDRFARYRGLAIARVPDEENRATPDIDAIAGEVAIEHTSVTSWKDQRRDAARFLQVLGVLEREEGHGLGFMLRVIVPYEVVAPGTDWAAVRESMRRWIRTEAAALPADFHGRVRVEGVPFEFVAWRDPDATGPGLVFWRSLPTVPTIDDFVKEQLDQKISKLVPYRAEGYRTVLLIESNDIHMSTGTLVAAIRGAYGGAPAGLDEVWYVDTGLPNEVRFKEITDHFDSDD